MNAILGSGILGLSYAMAQLGILCFFIICGGVAALAFYAIVLMLNMCKKTGAKAYETLGQEAFGDKGRYLVCLCIFCQNMGAMSSYLFIIKNELPSVLQTMMCDPDDHLCLSHQNPTWYFNGTYILLLVTLTIVVPLASLRHIGFLGYTSGFSISCMVFFTIVIVAKYFIGTEDCPLFEDAVASGAMIYSDYKEQIAESSDLDALKNIYLEPANATHLLKPGIYNPGNKTTGTAGEIDVGCTYNGHMPGPYCDLEPQECDAKLFALTGSSVYSMPTMTFSFVCHTAILPIFAELKSKSAGQMKKIAGTSIGSCFTLYFIASLFGYLTFFNYVQSELLMTYNHTDPTNALTLIVRICVIIGVILTLPLVHYPTRRAVDFVLRPGKPFSWPWHIGIMACLIGTCVILVILVPDIRDIFGFVGASSSSMLLFILPSLFYLKIMDGTWKTHHDKKFALIFLVFGACFSILTLGVIIASKIN